jgi:Tfp pilus assembly protein PilF
MHGRALLVAGHIAFLTAIPAAAQTPPRSELDVTRFNVVLDHPETRNVTVHPDVAYLTTPAGRQDIDIFLPPGLRAGETRPAVIFLNAIGDPPGATAKVKRWAIYQSWPRLVAAHGMVGIAMDADRDRIQESLRGVFRFLERSGANHGIDASRLGVYAASANVTGASVYLFGDSVSRGIKAAALYYGQVPTQPLRTDLPVLFVVPEGDAPGLGATLTALWQRVIETRAPWRLTYASRLPHAFDGVEDTDDSRRVMLETIGFWKSHLEPLPARSEPLSQARAVVASTYWNDAPRSAEMLASWVAANPRDTDGWVQLGRMRMGARQFAGADSAYQTALKLGAREADFAERMGQLRSAELRWDEAATYLNRAIALGSGGSFTWSQLGLAEMYRGRYTGALTAYERALAGGLPPFARVNAYYNMACAHAKLGQSDLAFEKLGKAIDAGFSNRRLMTEDEDLASIRSDQRFASLLGRLPT